MADNFEVALTRCYFCGQGNEIILNTRLTPAEAKKVKELHDKVLHMEPCPQCKEHMSKGVILITIDTAKSGKDWEKERMPNPYRTGGFFVVKDSLIERAFTHPGALKFAKEKRFLFIEHEAAVQMGLFRITEEQEKKKNEVK